MAFLLGAYGRTSALYMQKFLTIANAHAQHDSIQMLSWEQGYVIAGQKKEHQKTHNQTFMLNRKQGILVGKIFDRDNNNQSFTSEHALAKIMGENPHLLYKHFWGRYIGALYNHITNKLVLVRDPLGLSTLFYYQTPDGLIFSTEIALLYAIMEQKPSLDFAYFAEYIINRNNALASTPFQEIKELLPGIALEIDANGHTTQQLMWDIASLKSPYISDEDAYEEELLTVLKASVQAWTQDVDGICLKLSGGLDSSAILIALRAVLPTHKKLVAINMIDSQVPSSNEHEHAQKVADACATPLHFIDSATISLITELPTTLLPNSPTTFLIYYQLSQSTYDIARQHGCLEIMSGQGGDHVFCAPQPKAALADYWLDHGLRGITRPLKELSGAYRTSWGSLAHENLNNITNYYRKKTIKAHENISTSLLDATFAQTLHKPKFYLSDQLSQFYPAKSLHIQSLSHAIFYAERDRWWPQNVMTHPLLSLPLVECGLKIPTYQSFDDGYDRIFFRKATSKMRNSKALWRNVKGDTTGTMAQSFVREIDQITDLLTNGTLVKSGIINRQWLDDKLVKIRHGYLGDDSWLLLHLLTSELWLKQWKQ